MEERANSLQGSLGHYTFTIGISGLSSSGKTTLAHHLRTLFTGLKIPTGGNNTTDTVSFDVFLLHQDDFAFPESNLPLRDVTVKAVDGAEEIVEMADWDFPGAINFTEMTNALRLLRQGVSYKDIQGIQNKEAKDETTSEDQAVNTSTSDKSGETISNDKLKNLRDEIATKLTAAQWTSSRLSVPIKLIIVDGFMLYHQDEDEAEPTSSSLLSLLDLKLLLRVPYALAKQRREGREYVTPDGIWTDPKGYFDGIVWPNYVQYHRHLFVGGDVEDGQLTKESGPGGKEVELQPEVDSHRGMESLVRWASGRLVDVILHRMRMPGDGS